ncbi:UDP-N-acetylmuramoyl-L-alanyl-D-glutamate--2,6-diaminopimelate ligase [Weeksella virosa]|uniref:UDP-N-acetylmuramoyl-L-alanyl-D-glutamate--2,6-diaminopimelate ligase n=1 Tax=Weeksella virosa (strain ATCC 43766 / DSM 16922 / JCM 21250 / CCUG 30538 / CDC 9751 / IAM 14551 / NBRC 16016 / NCTC 11634 / CL345/78) TaxID=865938 RepID=F0P056_WEEVC|nr:UDP-N-acetylmuramoyl-L-alanyl-D-glutamate--2,6-diaminopimelate ligase [Weeksella virosa]ADX67403.1 UDP-N-acetylmuramoyl-L-alanyl-D-glutamate--2,6-d iaminopimelate ligase [Weeksella virosa DSM 16922]SUP53694.1 UDP-N-acetylmuramoyl-L-alanyl-D-glutamate--2,6-diaminopimelate ligase [Weeksella virosa]VEH62856.1 UDP-N-acetylmuramoyl-L-alanyl-D-glutamate--2,6-diaminopimelate ligase [Weeksella virosa]
MKQLTTILTNLSIIKTIGDAEGVLVGELIFDSRKAKKGDVFVAIKGTQTDGHSYIEQVTEIGVSVIVCEVLPEIQKENIVYVLVEDASIALGVMASNYYDNPTKNLQLVGITGTNGKTTTTSLLYELFTKLGYASVLVSTIQIVVDGDIIPTQNTTPDIVTLNRIFRQAVDKGCEYAFMEVSSHGIVQNRIAGLYFRVAAFTNITHDHLDYHITFQNYIQAKKKFFDELPASTKALVNLDDRNGRVMLQNTVASKHFFTLKGDAEFKGKILESRFDGMLLNFNQQEFWTNLIGQFNAYNLLLVYGIAHLLGQEDTEVLTILSVLGSVEGRFQTFHTQGDRVIIVDYAHTPDALENVLDTIGGIRTKNEQLITVVGCGGDRDKTKRPEMADIAARKSDLAIFTSDNPRTENPEAILADMEAGVEPQFYDKTLKITDRKEAIKTALKMSQKHDIILIAGKGHETYQEINGVRNHFSDVEVAKELSHQLNK